jgi:hypothetical protein
MREENIFYCYSKSLFHFLMSFDEKYIQKGTNKQSDTIYYTFRKSSRLDSLIELYNTIKHSVN